MPPRIPVVALALVRGSPSAHELLLVRKRGTARFMLPGGKREPGEDDQACLRRELREELDLAVDLQPATRLGRFEAPAANEAAHVVDAVIYHLALGDGPDPRPGAEIAEIRWLPLPVTEARPEAGLAPLVTDHVLPRLAQGRI